MGKPWAPLVHGAVSAVTVAFAAAAVGADSAAAAGRTDYDLNQNWRFRRQDVSGAQNVNFDDSVWATVSAPHTYNDVDSFDGYITSSGESSVAMQITWHRKHLTVPAAQAGRKAVLEFEGIRHNPEYGGLTKNVILHVVPRTYFTLPLYENLPTAGTYLYPSTSRSPAVPRP